MLGGKIYVIAGTNNSSVQLNDVWESDISTAGGRTWSEATSGSTAKFGARTYFASAVLGQGAAAKLYVIGGSRGSDYLSDVWNSDNGASWNQVSVTTAFSPGRVHHSSALLNEGADGGLYLIGGGISGGTAVRDVWRSTDGGATWVNVHENP